MCARASERRKRQRLGSAVAPRRASPTMPVHPPSPPPSGAGRNLSSPSETPPRRCCRRPRGSFGLGFRACGERGGEAPAGWQQRRAGGVGKHRSLRQLAARRALGTVALLKCCVRRAARQAARQWPRVGRTRGDVRAKPEGEGNAPSIPEGIARLAVTAVPWNVSEQPDASCDLYASPRPNYLA